MSHIHFKKFKDMPISTAPWITPSKSLSCDTELRLKNSTRDCREGRGVFGEGDEGTLNRSVELKH